MRLDKSRERLRREAADWLARMRGPTGEADRAALQRWLDADPAHAEAYERAKASFASAGLLEQTEMGRNRGLPDRRTRSRSQPYALAAGVAALLVISGALLLGRPQFLTAPAEAEMLQFATDVGEIRQVPLPDGSQMTLDTRSSVVVEMGRDLRQVIMREGRARFVVAPDERPFLVQAGRARVTGRDATFDVALRSGGTSVQPIEGSVSVASTSARDVSEPLRLQAGQAVLVSSAGATLQLERSARSSLWPNGMLEFDNTPLADAIGEANRYSASRILLADPSLADLRVTGTFRAGDLDGLARSLAAAFDLRLERRSDARLLLHPKGSNAPAAARKKNGG